MADNVAITAGSGTTIATDDVAGVHFQKVKIVAGTDGTEAALTRAEDAAHTDGDHGLMLLGVRNYAGAGTDGDYSALSIASDGLLRVDSHRDMIRIADSSASSELTIASTAYSAGDQVGVMFQFANAARATGGTGMIVGVTLINNNATSDVIGAYDVVFFRSNVTLAANNDPFSISATAGADLIAVVQLAGAFDLGNTRVAQAFNLAVPYDTGSGTTLFAALITRAGHTFFNAHTDLTLVVHVERN